MHKKNRLLNVIVLGIISGLIVISRPTNGLWLLMGMGFGINSFQDVNEHLKIWRLQWKKVLSVLLTFLAVVSIQLFYWKEITGSYFVYSYEKGSFDFARPEIWNVLFSVRKGLFFWSPILLTVFPGIYFVRKMVKEYFLPILIFLPLNIYIISSWSYWWYGGSSGQRPFVESIPLFAIALCALVEGISSKSGKNQFIR